MPKKNDILPAIIEFKTSIANKEVTFEVDFSKSLDDWEFEKQGRNLNLELYCLFEDLNEYKAALFSTLDTNFIEEIFSHEQALNRLFAIIKTNKLLYDYMVIKCTLDYQDENMHNDYTRFHGIGFTVNGKKHLAKSL